MLIAEAAVITKMVEGTELAPNNKKENKSIAAKMNKVMWGDKYWLRNNVATLTLLNKSHRAEPRQAQIYYVACLWRRMAQKSAPMRKTMEAVWQMRHAGTQEENETAKIRVKTGPMAVFDEMMEDVGWKWASMYEITRPNGEDNLDLRRGEDGQCRRIAKGSGSDIV